MPVEKPQRLQVKRSTVTKLYITGINNLDPITVFLEDLEPRKGKITVSCWGKSWTTYWGAMRDNRTVGQFFCELDTGYIIGCLEPSLRSCRFSGKALVRKARKGILKDRRRVMLGQDEARTLHEKAAGLRLAHSIKQLHITQVALMEQLFGDEWWYLAEDATEPNPDYLYLEKIIMAVQQALNQMMKRKPHLANGEPADHASGSITLPPIPANLAR